MKMRWRPPVLLALVSCLFWLLADAQSVRTAVGESLALCAGSVIPALFPFLVVSTLLTALGFGEWLAGPLSGLMALYGVGGAGAAALALGLLGGYPMGARTAAALVRDGVLPPEEGARLLTFCNNANPAFFMGVLGAGVFGSARAGLWLWLIHLLSALLAGLALRRGRLGNAGGSGLRRPALRAVRFSAAVVEAVRSAMEAMAGICAFVVFFYVLVLPLRQLPGLWGVALPGAVELFSAAPSLPPTAAGFVLAAGLSGWGGLSVHCQTLAVLGESGLSAAPCVAGKALQGLLSAALAALAWPYVLG